MNNQNSVIARWHLFVAFLTFLFGSGALFHWLKPTEQVQPQKVELSILPKEPIKPDGVNPEPIKPESVTHSKPEPSMPEASKPDPNQVDITLEQFAATYSSLPEKDRPIYLESLGGKKVTWTGYVSQLFLSDNYLYLSDKPDTPSGANVAVSFEKDMRLRVAPVKGKICVTGWVEIRGEWVNINASKLAVCP